MIGWNKGPAEMRGLFLCVSCRRTVSRGWASAPRAGDFCGVKSHQNRFPQDAGAPLRASLRCGARLTARPCAAAWTRLLPSPLRAGLARCSARRHLRARRARAAKMAAVLAAPPAGCHCESDRHGWRECRFCRSNNLPVLGSRYGRGHQRPYAGARNIAVASSGFAISSYRRAGQWILPRCSEALRRTES